MAFNRFYRNYGNNRGLQKDNINKEILEQMINRGAILLDVRSIQEYNEGHLKNAIQIADFELEERAEKILRNKNALIVVYCQSGNRSRIAYEILKSKGYRNVYNLYGGLNDMVY
jgi:rhodanese-related sulfurtransferase